MINPDSLSKARLDAGLTCDELTARAAAIGHSWLAKHDPGQEPGALREALGYYLDLAELGELGSEGWDKALPPTHPYIAWFAEGLDTTVLALIDLPGVDVGSR